MIPDSYITYMMEQMDSDANRVLERRLAMYEARMKAMPARPANRARANAYLNTGEYQRTYHFDCIECGGWELTRADERGHITVHFGCCPQAFPIGSVWAVAQQPTRRVRILRISPASVWPDEYEGRPVAHCVEWDTGDPLRTGNPIVPLARLTNSFKLVRVPAPDDAVATLMPWRHLFDDDVKRTLKGIK